MDGIINLNKPVGITSAKALYRVRTLTGQRKSGHAGSLDPAASGVLVLCLGRATGLVERVMDQPKVYRAGARLDVTSPSHDSDTELRAVEVCDVPSEAAIREALSAFEGEIDQVPPKISALKVGGVPAYKRTRRNQDFELAARRVTVYWLHLRSYNWPALEFDMACGRGTYVRSLVRDVGERLGTGGCLTALVRRAVGPFCEDRAWSFEALAAADGPEEYLVDLAHARTLLDRGAMTAPPRPV